MENMSPKIKAIDFFCSAGDVTCRLKQAGKNLLFPPGIKYDLMQN